MHPSSLSQALARTQALSYLKEEAFTCLISPTEIYDPLELLDHFIETKTPWIGSPECQRILQNYGPQLSLEAPYLLHAILAFSASHLSYLQPNEKRHSIAAALHYERSLNLYSSQLGKSLDKSNADAIYACCHLHSMLALRNVSLSSLEHQLADVDGYANGWLRAMQGTRVLREHITLQPEGDQGIWVPVRIEARTYDRCTCNHSKLETTNLTAHNTSIALHQLCGVDMACTAIENPYQQPLSRLCQLMRCDIGHGAIGMFMVFIGKLPSSFLQLLDKNDLRAMLIMVHWCALIGQIDQWWIVQSAKVECARFCRKIDKIPDPSIRGLLPFPLDMSDYTKGKRNAEID
jgi:hypothetical protein